MKAYLVDPFARTVTQVEYSGNYKDIYKHIHAECFDMCRIDENGDTLFVDDEGLYKEDQRFFVHPNYPQPLAGRALLLGSTRDGDSAEPVTEFEQFYEDIIFVEPIRVGNIVVVIKVPKKGEEDA